MNQKIFSVFLALTFLFYFVDAFPQQTSDSFPSKSLKTVKNHGPNRYNSTQVYVFGGADENGQLQSSVSYFNSSTGEWKSTTNMSLTKWVMAGAVVGTKIHLFGGFSNDINKVLETAEVYDCKTGTYSQYRSMPGPRWGSAAAVLNGHIYVAGGWNWFTGKRLSSVIRYNIETTEVETVTSMNVERQGLQLIEFKERLYAIGGFSTQSVEVYNPNTDRWSKVSCTNFEHQYPGVAVHEGKIYVCSINGFEVYDPEADEWTVLPAPSKKIRSNSLVVMDGKLWSFGGDIDHKFMGSKAVSTYNFATKKWSDRPDMDVARAYHTTLVVNH